MNESGELSPANESLLRQMERYATGVGCRHRHLAEYFGDEYPTETTGEQRGCAACDYCLDELETGGRTDRARSKDSVVCRPGRAAFRCDARGEYLARARLGTGRHERSRQVEHVRATAGRLEGVTEVRGYIEQLTGLGLLRQAGNEYPVLALTSAGLECLKDETRCSHLRLARQRPPRKAATRAQSRAEAESWEGVDRDLFDRLRAVRLEIARSRGVPPYVIFHDATLREMARLRPSSLDALLTVKGVGARKADDLGEIFLKAIRDAS